MIGDRIQNLRKANFMTQSELASKVETDSATISRWETNRVKPGQKYILKLAKALHTTADYLLGDTDDPQEHEVSNASDVKLQKISPNSEDYSFTEKLINSNKMIVYETNSGRFFIPATSDGFAFIKNMGAGNFARAN